VRNVALVTAFVGRFHVDIHEVLPAAEQGGKGGVVLNIHIPKLADQIIVREEADIDRIGEAVTKQVILAVSNSA